MKTTPTFQIMGQIDADLLTPQPAATKVCQQEPPRLRRPDRQQMSLEPCCLDKRLVADHAARIVWAVVERLDLSRFYGMIQARGELPGRAATDPKLLIALWLYAAIQDAAQEGVAIFAPLPATGTNGSVCIHNDKDSPAVAAWRARMQTPQGQAAYKQRSATSETVNADLKTYRGLGPLTVRGLTKVRCVALWSVLAYNLMHFAAALLLASG